MMTTLNKGVIPVLLLTTAAALAAAPATAQDPRSTTVASAARAITTSTLVQVSPGQALAFGSVALPACAKGTSFLVTDLLASPFGGDVSSLQSWRVSVQAFQKTGNGSFSAQLTVFGKGSQHASASIPGGQPILDDDQIVLQFLGGDAEDASIFNVHVTGYCGTPFISP
ncbi:hypothetical protein LuPra_00840 [Luteitalea pratensis]|uniref:Uncharacterized protein n=1 Tax=Luteitalea pratensis TaxID=1855912 RepID=A0A143PIS0_LUTPR|nr:hypothetical protein [Luteitalea pratensis]AMY07664.1 hypothetical protein LuPra_00840 [Luteitalea pratensis]